jgi:hypothetical protein
MRADFGDVLESACKTHSFEWTQQLSTTFADERSRRYAALLHSRPPVLPSHSDSIVRIGPNELICRCKKRSALKTSVARTVRCAWLLNSKRNLIAPEILRFQPLSISIGPLFPNPLAPPHRRRSRKLSSAARGIDRDVAWSDRRPASDRITASVAGDLPRISRAIRTVPREAARTRRACGIRTP